MATTTRGVKTVDSAAAVGLAMNVSPETVRRWLELGAPRKKTGARSYSYNLAEIHKWLETVGPRRPRPILVKPVSRSLERYRAARAAIAEKELRERRDDLVDVVRVKRRMAATFKKLTQCGDRLGERFGPAARKLMLDTIADARRLLEGTEFDPGPERP